MLRAISKAVFPAMERDMNRSIGKELASMEVNNMLAPQVFGYTKPAAAASGAFRGTQNVAMRRVKVEYPAPTKQGLFH